VAAPARHAHCPTPAPAAPTVRRAVPSVARRRVRRERVHRMYVAGTVPRVWPCRAPPRGASGRVAKPRGRRSARGIFPRARAPRAQRPAPTVAWVARRVAHHRVRHERAHRTHMAGTVPRVWPCRAPPRGASSRAAIPRVEIHLRIISSRARPRAAALRPLPSGSPHVSRTVVCATSTRMVRVSQAQLCRACGRAVGRRAVRRVAPRTAGSEPTRGIFPSMRAPRAPTSRAPCRVGRAACRAPTCAPRARAPCARNRYYNVRLVTPCTAARCVGPRRETAGPEFAPRIVFVPRESRAPCGAPTAAWAAPRVALRRVRHEPAHVRASQAPCRACCRAVRRRVVRRFAPRPAGSELAREPPTAAWVAPRVAHRRVRHEHGPRIRYVPTRGEASSQPLSHGATRAAQGAAVSRYVGSTHVA
jgi:hypothetical protein